MLLAGINLCLHLTEVSCVNLMDFWLLLLLLYCSCTWLNFLAWTWVKITAWFLNVYLQPKRWPCLQHPCHPLFRPDDIHSCHRLVLQMIPSKAGTSGRRWDGENFGEALGWQGSWPVAEMARTSCCPVRIWVKRRAWQARCPARGWAGNEKAGVLYSPSR